MVTKGATVGVVLDSDPASPTEADIREAWTVNMRGSIMTALFLSLSNDTVNNSRAICGFASMDLIAVVGPLNTALAAVLHYGLQHTKVPQIVPDKTVMLPRSEYLMDVSPLPSYLAAAVTSLLIKFKWPYLKILVDSEDEGSEKVISLLNRCSHVDIKATLLVVKSEESIRSILLHSIESTGRIILALCKCRNLQQVIQQAVQLDMMSPGWGWIILEEGMKCITSSHLPAEGLIAILPDFAGSPHYQDTDCGYECDVQPDIRFYHRSFRMLSKAFTFLPQLRKGNRDYSKKLQMQEIASSTVCQGSNKMNASPYMRNALLAVKESSYSYKFHYYNLRNEKWRKFGVWDKTDGYGALDVVVYFPGDTSYITGYQSSLRGQHIWACTHVDSDEGGWKTIWTSGKPNESEFDSIPKDRISGFQASLFERLSYVIGFNFTWRYPRDQQWGGFDKEKLTWNGILREIEEGWCDIGAATLTITRIRERDFDFTAGYFETGLTFITKKPGIGRDTFRFFVPFKPTLWYQLLIALTLVGIILGLINRMSPYEYRGEFIMAHHDMGRKRGLQKTFRRYYKEAVQVFSFPNAQWFAWCSLFQQGGAYPMSVSGRLVALCWWLAVLLFTATYTANMAALFTTEILTGGIESIQDLGSQGRVLYGTQAASAAYGFFDTTQVPLYQQMFNFMTRRHDGLIQPLRDGIERARRGDYAFIWDKAVLDFEALQHPCDLATIGDAFNKIIYSYALRKDSPYTKELSYYILRLKEDGYIQDIYNKWFYGRSQCPSSSDETDNKDMIKPLGFWNMSGVFLIIYVLLLISAVVLMLEWMYSCYHLLHFEKAKDVSGICSAMLYRFKRINRDVQLYYIPDAAKKRNSIITPENTRSQMINKLIAMSKQVDGAKKRSFQGLVAGVVANDIAGKIMSPPPRKTEKLIGHADNKSNSHIAAGAAINAPIQAQEMDSLSVTNLRSNVNNYASLEAPMEYMPSYIPEMLEEDTTHSFSNRNSYL